MLYLMSSITNRSSGELNNAAGQVGLLLQDNHAVSIPSGDSGGGSGSGSSSSSGGGTSSGGQWKSGDALPGLAVCFANGFVQISRDENDPHPVQFDAGMTIIGVLLRLSTLLLHFADLTIFTECSCIFSCGKNRKMQMESVWLYTGPMRQNQQHRRGWSNKGAQRSQVLLSVRKVASCDEGPWR